MQHWVQVFRDILDEENFLQIHVITYCLFFHSQQSIFLHACIYYLQVSDQDEYEQTLQSFPYRDDELQKAPFPKKFPFSMMVPKVYHQVKEFIYACLKFSEDLNLTQTEIDEMICKSTNLLLTRTFSGCLSSYFRKPSLSLNQIVQIIIDTEYLENSTKYLEEFLSNITGYN